MDELQAARTQIDAIDAQMAQLFAQRMDAVRHVVQYKRQHGLPVLDASREEAVVSKNLALLPQPEYAEWYEAFLRHNMALSRQFQARVLGEDIAAYQGVEGAFSHIVTQTLFPHARQQACATWAQVFDAVEHGDAAYGVLPFENSNAGDVSEVLDLCFLHESLHVVQMYDLPVRQNLLGVPGATLADVRTVVSHPQALSQTTRFCGQLGVATQACINTAEAARLVAQQADKSVAAIASQETAALYGLTVLAQEIQNREDNTTRFIIIGRKSSAQGNRFSLLFTVEHTVGALAGVIQAIGALGINMECIKSRPMPGAKWEYYFYTEMVGSPTPDVLDALAKICKTVRLLGVYERA